MTRAQRSARDRRRFHSDVKQLATLELGMQRGNAVSIHDEVRKRAEHDWECGNAVGIHGGAAM
jgi:post-segregation antitoxin (ccd killing protein)